MRINGEHRKIGASTLADLLRSNGYDEKRVAVELNGKIVPRKDYSGVMLRDNDVLEIVSFVGGG